MYNIALDAVIRKALIAQMEDVMKEVSFREKLTYMTHVDAEEWEDIRRKLEVIYGLESSIKDYLQIEYYKAATRKLYMLNILVEELKNALKKWGN